MSSEKQSKVQIPQGLLIDVDGTLTNSQQCISDRTAKVISKLINKNIKIGIATGRQYAALVNYILPFFPKDSLHIVAGGGQILSGKGKVVWQKLIPHTKVINLCTTVERLGGNYVFGQGPVLYSSQNLLEGLSQHPWDIQVDSAKKLLNWSTPLVSILQINKAVHDFLSKKGGLTIKEIHNISRPPYFDITAPGVEKGRATRFWSKKQGIALKNILAVGDSINDLEFLSIVGQGVAMGQSPPELKAVARKTIQHTDEDGLALFLESLFNL